MRRLALIILATLLAGCMVGPDYRRPAVEAPGAWRTGAEAQGKESVPLVDTRWWEQMGDPVLNDLIGIAMRESKDLLVASARVEEFAARYGVVRADLFPQVGADAQYERQRVTERSANQLPSGYNASSDIFSTTLNASWEIDIWGRVRRAGEAARAQLIATEEGRQAVILSLVSSVAASYINLRNLDRQLEISEKTVDSRKKSLELFEQRFKVGLISEMELFQVKTLYEDALASVPQLKNSIAQQENGLCVLLGRDPGPIRRGRNIDQLVLPQVPAGLPSELLTRRPDIRQAEQNLIAANAQIGVARAAYFPAISLTGLFGVASSDLSHLFTGPARVWSYGASLTVPIFTAGKISGQVKAAEAQREQAIISYRQAIQNAFRDVENSLVDQGMTRQQLAVRGKQVEDFTKYVYLANLRYENGYSNYLDVLDAERSLFNSQLSYVQNQASLFQALINLYKAMGGGWAQEADALSRKTAGKY
ncbi:MAG TPA: efflux transporter outer membrane subunit [Desulfuromonadaceae bacterium]